MNPWVSEELRYRIWRPIQVRVKTFWRRNTERLGHARYVVVPTAARNTGRAFRWLLGILVILSVVILAISKANDSKSIWENTFVVIVTATVAAIASGFLIWLLCLLLKNPKESPGTEKDKPAKEKGGPKTPGVLWDSFIALVVWGIIVGFLALLSSEMGSVSWLPGHETLWHWILNDQIILFIATPAVLLAIYWLMALRKKRSEIERPTKNEKQWRHPWIFLTLLAGLWIFAAVNASKRSGIQVVGPNHPVSVEAPVSAPPAASPKGPHTETLWAPPAPGWLTMPYLEYNMEFWPREPLNLAFSTGGRPIPAEYRSGKLPVPYNMVWLKVQSKTCKPAPIDVVYK